MGVAVNRFVQEEAMPVFFLVSFWWRVTLLSIHVGELKVIPRRLLSKLERLLSQGVPTMFIKRFEIDQKEMRKMSKEIYEQIK